MIRMTYAGRNRRQFMRKVVSLSIAVGLMTSPGLGFADAEMLRKHNCVACHHNERKMVGPSYKDIAAKYSADATAAEKLAAKIREGGSGVWGQMPMPPQPHVSDADASTLAKYVLTIK
jgi:cytochrome c